MCTSLCSYKIARYRRELWVGLFCCSRFLFTGLCAIEHRGYIMVICKKQNMSTWQLQLKQPKEHFLHLQAHRQWRWCQHTLCHIQSPARWLQWILPDNEFALLTHTGFHWAMLYYIMGLRHCLSTTCLATILENASPEKERILDDAYSFIYLPLHLADPKPC